MMVIVFFALLLASGGFPPAQTSCPSKCSCLYHNLSDGAKVRSVICNDPEMSLVPTSFPTDTCKLTIEKTAIKRISTEAFKGLPDLEFLWLSFNVLSSVNVDSFRGLNSLEELRLDGNFLTTFPWESLKYTPNLKLLDLHSNKLSSISREAAKYVRTLTYLDLSSNNLLTMPSEVLTTWMTVPTQGAERSKIILGLHDNPWLCDCRLYDLVQFQKSASLSVAFIETSLRCTAPESLSGVPFIDADLRRCQEPKVHSAVSRIRSTVGNNVLLRCGAVGVPVPKLTWRRADGKILNGTVKEENSKDGIVWSILNVPAVSFHDSGKYICKATNYGGSTEAAITLIVSKAPKFDNGSETVMKLKDVVQNPVEKEMNMTKAISPGPSSVPVTTSPLGYIGSSAGLQSDHVPENETNAQLTSSHNRLLKTNVSNLTANASFLQQDFYRIVRSVKVIGDTDFTVCLIWRAPKANNTTAFSVLYAVFGERDMRRINVSPGNNRIIIDGLVPKTKYIACVCVKGLIPKKEQCVIFSTDAAASANGTQKLINVVVISVACVIAVPLTVVVCCGALKRKIQKLLSKKSKDVQDSYVTFESLSTSTKAKGLEEQYLSKLNPEESNKLLSDRSILVSEPITKTEQQPNEYSS